MRSGAGGLQPGDVVVARPDDARFDAGPELLGRVLDGFGQPMDGGPPVRGEERRDLYATPPGPLEREPISERWSRAYAPSTGFLPFGKRQRIGIFGGPGLGKSTLLGAMARHHSADVGVIALIGERNRQVREFLERELSPEGLKRSVVVAPSDAPVSSKGINSTRPSRNPTTWERTRLPALN